MTRRELLLGMGAALLMPILARLPKITPMLVSVPVSVPSPPDNQYAIIARQSRVLAETFSRAREHEYAVFFNGIQQP